MFSANDNKIKWIPEIKIASCNNYCVKITLINILLEFSLYYMFFFLT